MTDGESQLRAVGFDVSGTFEERLYPIHLLMFGTSWLGETRVIAVDRLRQAERGEWRERQTLIRWGERQWRRHEASWYMVGGLHITYSQDTGELFLRNRAAYRVDVRAIRIDDEFRRWLALSPTRPVLDTKADAVSLMVPIE